MLSKTEFEDRYVGKIHCADCLEVMKDWPENCVDLVLTDPPYGIDADKMRMGSGKHNWHKEIGWDGQIPTKQAFEAIRRISLNQIIWGGNYFTDYLPPTANWLVWDKNNPNLSFAEGELAWVSNGDRLRIFKRYSANIDKMHPTEKPIELALWCVGRYSRENDLIADPYCGTGAFCVAAKMLGRRYIGIDISEKYCEIARQRLEAVDTGVPVKEQKAGQLALEFKE